MYTDKVGNECYLLSGENDEMYILNKDDISIQNWGMMCGLDDVFNDIDASCIVYAIDIDIIKKYLIENKNEIENDIDKIIENLKEIH